MVTRPRLWGHVIYDGRVRRFTLILVGALALIAIAASSGNGAAGQTPTPTSSTLAPTTTTTAAPATTTTAATTPPTTRPVTTTTTAKPSTGSKPPPASGAAQPLDPSLLGGAPIPTIAVATTTSSIYVPPLEIRTTPTTVGSNAATAIVRAKDGPPGSTMVLATVAWLASLGGLLVYMEDRRGQRWRHLAR